MQVLHSFQCNVNIMHPNLRRLDLNLLLIFDALFRHRSVVAAADELSMSPSACSHALSRLREAMADELFVRAGSTMQPTAQAVLMADAVADALRILSDQLTTSTPFVPESSTQTFVFAATDYTAYALLPSLVARLELVAPHLCIKVINAAHRDSLDELSEGRIHFALGVSHGPTALPEGVEAFDCLSDDYLVVAREGHTRVGASLSLQQYLAERHVAVLPWDDASSVIDSTLARAGLQRDVAVKLPSVMAAPFIVAQSDHLFTVPRLAALQLSNAVPLVMHAVPFEVPRYTLRILHHVRHASTAGHRWMREQMLLALGG
jgi:DNA-binding transcriptional LysR family regulator